MTSSEYVLELERMRVPEKLDVGCWRKWWAKDDSKVFDLSEIWTCLLPSSVEYWAVGLGYLTFDMPVWHVTVRLVVGYSRVQHRGLGWRYGLGSH